MSCLLGLRFSEPNIVGLRGPNVNGPNLSSSSELRRPKLARHFPSTRFRLLSLRLPRAERHAAVALTSQPTSFTAAWQLAPAGAARSGLLAALAAAAVGAVAAFQALVPQARAPELWGVPGMPWVPAASVFLNVFLLGSLDKPSYVRFGVFSAAAVLVYVLYSVHASHDAAAEEGSVGGGAKVQDDDGCKV